MKNPLAPGLPFLLLLVGLSLNIGCSSTNHSVSSCQDMDWYEAGRRDGSQGATAERLTEYRKSCASNFQADWETVYMNGRNAGLVEYCESRNGYELGRMGISYFYVCPAVVESDFLSFYRKGQKARDLEVENNKLNVKIDELAQKLVATNDQFYQRQIASELSQLKRTRALKEKELEKITSSN